MASANLERGYTCNKSSVIEQIIIMLPVSQLMAFDGLKRISVEIETGNIIIICSIKFDFARTIALQIRTGRVTFVYINEPYKYICLIIYS